MSLVQVAVSIFVSMIVFAGSLYGLQSEFHASKIKALETSIRTLEQAAVQYGQINQGYSGLSCGALATDNLIPPQDCNGTNYITVFPTASVVVQPISSLPNDFEITVQDSTDLTATDFTNIYNSFDTTINTTRSSNNGASGLALVFGNE